MIQLVLAADPGAELAAVGREQLVLEGVDAGLFFQQLGGRDVALLPQALQALVQGAALLQLAGDRLALSLLETPSDRGTGLRA